MRRVLIVLGISAISSSALADSPSLDQFRTLQKRVDALEMLVKDLTTGTTKASIAQSEDVELPVQIVDWSETTWYDRSQPFYRISYTITNNSAKTIKLIQASIGFQDVHGAELFRIPIDHSLVIAPGEAALIARDYLVSGPASSKDGERERVPKLVKADIVGKLVVRSVVYSDNSIVNYPR